MLILAIESSCDETAVCIMDEKCRVLSHKLHSQIDIHAQFGGVVPELAARAHIEYIEHLTQSALNEAQVTLSDIDVFSATTTPGLMGGLIVGATFAKTLAAIHNKRFVAINHLHGHALSVRWGDADYHDNHAKCAFPYLLLLVSGGHCQIILVGGVNDFRVLGGTLDDAAGECFDKAARIMDIGFPGGPAIEKYALNGNPAAFKFEIPLKRRKNGYDFSFSGLKTAVDILVKKIGILTWQNKCDIAWALQYTISEHLLIVCKRAMLNCTNTNRVVVAGGVAANKVIRQKLQSLADELNWQFIAPPLHLCTDNAIMIAQATLEILQNESP